MYFRYDREWMSHIILCICFILCWVDLFNTLLVKLFNTLPLICHIYGIFPPFWDKYLYVKIYIQFKTTSVKIFILNKKILYLMILEVGDRWFRAYLQHVSLIELFILKCAEYTCVYYWMLFSIIYRCVCLYYMILWLVWHI